MARRSVFHRKTTVVSVRSELPDAHVVRLDTIDDARLAASFADELLTIEMEVPAQLLVLQGGFSFTSPDNPLIIGLEQGPDALARFYAAHAPADLCAMYGLDRRGLPGEELAPWELPWLHRFGSRRQPRGEHGLGPEHGLSYYGPATAEKVALEIDRLRDVRRSIERSGYRPSGRTGTINGNFLVAGSEYRFFVRGGKHRAAALASLGHSHVPVRFRPAWPRIVDRRDAASWSLVLSGETDLEVARSAFDAHFVARTVTSPTSATTQRTGL